MSMTDRNTITVVLDCTRKLIQMTMNNQLKVNISTDNLNYGLQSTYRKKRSIETGLFKANKLVPLSINQDKRKILILLDLSATLDSMNRHILIGDYPIG